MAESEHCEEANWCKRTGSLKIVDASHFWSCYVLLHAWVLLRWLAMIDGRGSEKTKEQCEILLQAPMYSVSEGLNIILGCL